MTAPRAPLFPIVLGWIALLAGSGCGEGGDAAAQTCNARTEASCTEDRRCGALRGARPEDHCAGRGSYGQYGGCAPAGQLCNTVFTWASDPGTGRTLVFTCSLVPEGWTRAVGNQCPLDGGSAD